MTYPTEYEKALQRIHDLREQVAALEARATAAEEQAEVQLIEAEQRVIAAEARITALTDERDHLKLERERFFEGLQQIGCWEIDAGASSGDYNKAWDEAAKYANHIIAGAEESTLDYVLGQVTALTDELAAVKAEKAEVVSLAAEDITWLQDALTLANEDATRLAEGWREHRDTMTLLEGSVAFLLSCLLSGEQMGEETERRIRVQLDRARGDQVRGKDTLAAHAHLRAQADGAVETQP